MNYLKVTITGASAILVLLLGQPSHADLSAGCKTAGISSGTYSLSQDGIDRVYRLFVPSGYQPEVASPLIAIFHGWGGDENEFLNSKEVTSLAEQRGYILVAPRGLGSGDGEGSNNSWTFNGSATGLDGDGVNTAIPGDSDAICDAEMTPDYSYSSCAGIKANSCSWTQCRADDVDFVLALIEKIEAQLCVDTDAVFATGGSNGGMFTWELAQNPETASSFRAIAPIIGLPHRAYLSGPGTNGELPVLLITGMQDPTVPPGAWEDARYTTTSNGSDRYYYTGATAITRVWAQAHDCDISTAAAAVDTAYEGVDCRSYCGGNERWPVVLDCRAEMGHTYEFDWSWTMVLDFFDVHSPAGKGD